MDIVKLTVTYLIVVLIVAAVRVSTVMPMPTRGVTQIITQYSLSRDGE